jgi:chemotaxis protein methyltransferase CheR
VENSFKNLINYIEKKTAFRCQCYKEKPLKRRIRVRMRALDIKYFTDYELYLRKNEDELVKLVDTITINLSYFFRNLETFIFLKDYIFPEMKKRKDKFVFWSAGCAQGEEPYTLAIIAAESKMLEHVTIYATDIDKKVLDIAQQGVYSDIAFQYAPDILKKRYFTRVDNGFSINKNVKKRVRFFKADLFTDPPFGSCDLIMCRNVMIYLGREAQSTVLRNFYEHLAQYGYLVIGKVELLIGIPEIDLFKTISRVEHVYQKKDVIS